MNKFFIKKKKITIPTTKISVDEISVSNCLDI